MFSFIYIYIYIYIYIHIYMYIPDYKITNSNKYAGIKK